MSEIREILDERGSNYGDYSVQAKLSQDLKEMIITPIVSRGIRMEPYMAESLELICMKLSRIATGDVNHADSWRDIAGYSTLTADRIPNKDAITKALIDAGMVSLDDCRRSLQDDSVDAMVHVYHHDQAKSTEKAGESSSDYPFVVGDIAGEEGE